jgi:hypothetical protein
LAQAQRIFWRDAADDLSRRQRAGPKNRAKHTHGYAELVFAQHTAKVRVTIRQVIGN